MSKRKVKHKTATFSLEPDGFSVHTFELSRKIEWREYHSIKEALYHQQEESINRGWMYRDEKTGNHVCNLYNKNGIRIHLEHFGDGKANACYISMLVNPRKLVDPNSSYLGILPPEKSSVRKVTEAFSELFESSPFEPDINAYRLRRVDLCTNIRCDNKKLFRELVRVLRKQSAPPKYERCYYTGGDKRTANDYNKHYISFRCGTHELVLYDKTYQMRKERLVLSYEKLPKGVLRFEVHCKRGYLRTVEKKAGEPATTELLWLMIQESRERIINHFSRCFSDVAFARKEELDRIIKKSRYREKAKTDMLDLVDRLQRIQSVDKALKKMEKAGYNTDGLLERFIKLGISPVPLWHNFCARQMPGPVELLKSVSEGGVTVEYVRIK